MVFYQRTTKALAQILIEISFYQNFQKLKWFKTSTTGPSLNIAADKFTCTMYQFSMCKDYGNELF